MLWDPLLIMKKEPKEQEVSYTERTLKVLSLAPQNLLFIEVPPARSLKNQAF